MDKKYRVEKDSLGEVQVPADCYWGAQTERSRSNFRIGGQKMSIEVVRALAVVKKAAAIVNCDLGMLARHKRDLIVSACDEIIAGQLDDQFPLVAWQAGSGTQTNMNVNEVISNRASAKAGKPLGSKDPVHPNDDVNLAQSTNDVFPSAMNIASVKLIRERLIPALSRLHRELEKKVQDWSQIIKVGRTHLMDATPILLGQEFSGYASQLQHALTSLEFALTHLSELAIGGTAVGTGLATKEPFARRAVEVINQLTGLSFIPAHNLFEALAGEEALVGVSAALRQVATGLIKMATDIRWGVSGPRCGIGELLLSANEPGSSIMAGKVNPTQCEALIMVSIKVIGNDTAIAMAAAMGGNFELNVFKPVIIFNLMESTHLLADAVDSFTEKCLVSLQPNLKRIEENLNKSLMLATALNGTIGYDKTAQVVKKAYAEECSLMQAAVDLGYVTEQQFREIVDPRKMVGPSA